VVLKEENAAALGALHDWMKRRLAEFKMPVRWYALDSLPRNSRGKISRKEVEERCAAKKPLDLASILRDK
jgi:acyl-coenzyme A synthetase/AMP-(fatty) acid ligase